MTKQHLLRELPWIDLAPSARILSLLTKSLRSNEYPFYCIQGPHGSGKTRIMLEVAKALAEDEGLWIAGIDAKNSDVSTAIFKALGETNINPNITLKERLTLALKQKFSLGKKVVLLIDSAELLDEDILRLLLDLGKSELCQPINEQYHFSLMLFMGMVPTNIYTKKLLSEAQSYTLPPMNAVQIKRLIEHVHEFYGKAHDFSSSDISRLHGMSYGYPGRLFNLLNLKRDKNFLLNKYYAMGALLLIVVGAFFILKPFVLSKISRDSIAKDSIMNIPIIAENETMVAQVPLIAIDQGNIIAKVDDKLEAEAVELHTVIDPRQSLDQESANVDEQISAEVTTNSDEPPKLLEDPQKAEYFIIRLTEGATKQAALNALAGRSVPGSPQSTQIMDKGAKKWITYIGPYTTKTQATAGMKHLPNSLQRLNLKVLSNEVIQ